MKKTAIKVLALAAAGLLLLSGCAQNSPQVAARVGSSTVSVAEIDTLAKDVAAAADQAGKGSNQPPTAWGDLRAPLVEVIINAKIAEQAKQIANVEVTDAERAQLFKQAPLMAVLAANPATTNFLNQWIDLIMVQNDAKAQQVFAKLIAATQVEVNPAFGVWDPSQSKLSGATGSLSQVLKTNA